MPDLAPTCAYCGEHHTSTCKQELSLQLADQKAEAQVDHAAICSLRLEITDLRWQLTQKDMTRYAR